MSRWLFFPTQSAGFDLVLDATVIAVQGTPVNTAYSGTVTASTGTLPGGLISLQNRQYYGLGFVFNNSTERNTFVSNYPSGVGAWDVLIGTSVGSTGSGWSYDNSISWNTAYILQSDFSPFAPAPYAVGEIVEVSHS